MDNRRATRGGCRRLARAEEAFHARESRAYLHQETPRELGGQRVQDRRGCAERFPTRCDRWVDWHGARGTDTRCSYICSACETPGFKVDIAGKTVQRQDLPRRIEEPAG